MRRLSIPVLCIVLVALTAAFVWRDRGMKKMPVTVSARDLPQEGLVLITAGDKNFTNILANSGNQLPELDAVLPFSVILRNTGNQPAICFMLKWDLVTPDGVVSTRHYEYVTAFALEGGIMDQQGGYVLKPGSDWIFGPGFGIELRNFPTTGPTGSRAVNFTRIAHDLAQFSSGTVSLDGAFFNDGTFVGPNNTHFFEKIEAFQRARRDVLNELSKKAKTKNNYEDVFGEVLALAKQPRKRLDKKSTINNYYDLFKADLAADIMSMKKVSGSQKTLDHYLKSLKREWATLKKKA